MATGGWPETHFPDRKTEAQSRLNEDDLSQAAEVDDTPPPPPRSWFPVNSADTAWPLICHKTHLSCVMYPLRMGRTHPQAAHSWVELARTRIFLRLFRDLP